MGRLEAFYSTDSLGTTKIYERRKVMIKEKIIIQILPV